jgi:protein phosphatase
MNNEMLIVCGHATHQGLKRQDNQDAWGRFPEDGQGLSSSKGQLFIVADGMGGHAGGKEASWMAVRLVREAYFADPDENTAACLERAFAAANAKIHQRASDSLEFHGMGTTCTALVLKDDRLYVAHLGDSRAYRITKSKIEQLTQDHTKVAEMLRLGILTREEALHHPEKSHLYRALGIAATMPAEVSVAGPLRAGERYLLCTDGIAKVELPEVKRMVLENSPQDACDRLIKAANDRGGSDNSTVQVIEVRGAARTGAFAALRDFFR